MLAAKAENMPPDNIKRAIQRGTGELEGVKYEEITFEGYGPGGVAIIVEVLDRQPQSSSQRNSPRIFKEWRQPGRIELVSWMFSKKGLISVAKSVADEDKLMTLVLEAWRRRYSR